MILTQTADLSHSEEILGSARKSTQRNEYFRILQQQFSIEKLENIISSRTSPRALYYIECFYIKRFRIDSEYGIIVITYGFSFALLLPFLVLLVT